MTKEQQQLGIELVGEISSVIVLATLDGIPSIWIGPFGWVDNKPDRWIITRGGDNYMFKENGLFGKTDDPKDKKRNSFQSIDEAKGCFYDHYGHWRKEEGYKVCLVAGHFHAGRSLKTIREHHTISCFGELLRSERGRARVKRYMEEHDGIGIAFWNGSKLELTDGSGDHCNPEVWYHMHTVNELLKEHGMLPEFSMTLEPFKAYHADWLFFNSDHTEYEKEHAEEIEATRIAFREFVKSTHPDIYEKVYKD